VIVFALRREAMFFRKRVQPCRRLADAPWPVFVADFQGQSTLLMETGVGASSASAALRWLLDKKGCRPEFVLSAGFSGALKSGLNVGDVIVASEIVDDQGKCWQAACPPLPVPFRRERLLCMPDLVCSPQDKHQLSSDYQAAAVDMESAALAKQCQELRVVFCSLKAISDDCTMALSPRLGAVLRGGRVSWFRLVRSLACWPPLILELWTLAKATQRAARELDRGLHQLLLLRSLPTNAEHPDDITPAIKILTTNDEPSRTRPAAE
jgi:adenosylhomocysteine nucleosidase